MSTSALFVDTILREMRGILPIPDALVAGLISHYELLLRWNPRMNLTTVTKPEEAAVRHYCESLFLAAHIGEGSVADIGSGPGFSGMTLTMAFSSTSSVTYLMLSQAICLRLMPRIERAVWVGPRLQP